MAITSINDDDIMDLLSKIPQSDDKSVQTLLFVSFFVFSKKEVSHKSTVVDKLRKTQDKYNIIARLVTKTKNNSH